MFDPMRFNDVSEKSPLEVAGLSPELVREVNDVSVLRELATNFIKKQQVIKHPDKQRGDARRSAELNTAYEDLSVDDELFSSLRQAYLEEHPFTEQLTSTREQADEGRAKTSELSQLFAHKIGEYCGVAGQHYLAYGPCTLELIDVHEFLNTYDRQSEELHTQASQREGELARKAEERALRLKDENIEEEYLAKVRDDLLRDDHPDCPEVWVTSRLEQDHPDISERLRRLEEESGIIEDFPDDLVKQYRAKYRADPAFQRYEKLVRERALQLRARALEHTVSLSDIEENLQRESEATGVPLSEFAAELSRTRAKIFKHRGYAIEVDAQGGLALHTGGTTKRLEHTTLLGFLMRTASATSMAAREDMKLQTAEILGFSHFNQIPSSVSLQKIALEDFIFAAPELRTTADLSTREGMCLVVALHTPPDESPYISVLGDVLRVQLPDGSTLAHEQESTPPPAPNEKPRTGKRRGVKASDPSRKGKRKRI